jgi:serine acetyltransferase
LAAGRTLGHDVLEDYGAVQKNRAKYHGERISRLRLPVDLLRKVGFQTATGVRLMQFARNAGLPVAPQLISRLLRHLYGVEIHWAAKVAPGLSIVHGCGIVISHAATVGPGCILFHNVTLGEGLDPVHKKRGAPVLGANVHVGPGCTLLGPITVGNNSKIAAGSVLTASVPDNAVVMPAPVQVRARAARAQGVAAGGGDEA